MFSFMSFNICIVVDKFNGFGERGKLNTIKLKMYRRVLKRERLCGGRERACLNKFIDRGPLLTKKDV